MNMRARGAVVDSASTNAASQGMNCFVAGHGLDEQLAARMPARMADGILYIQGTGPIVAINVK